MSFLQFPDTWGKADDGFPERCRVMLAPHPVEPRLRAVQLARTGDKPVGVLAKDLGISESGLRSWGARPIPTTPVAVRAG